MSTRQPVLPPVWSRTLRAIRAAYASLALVALGVTGTAGVMTDAQAAPQRDRLVLLVPDNASLTDWTVKVWLDSAAEQGIKLVTMTDREFLAKGAAAATDIAGLILPDSAHNVASDELVAAVKAYANLGGRLMLTYDAGALTPAGAFAPVRSRFSDLVGVDYTMYDTLLDRVVGLGAVVGTESRLQNLGMPPGKYLPYTSATTLSGATASTSVYAAATPSDPGATRLLRAGQLERVLRRIDERSANVRASSTRLLRDTLGLSTAPIAGATVKPKVSTTSATLSRVSEGSVAADSAQVKAMADLSGTAALEMPAGTATPSTTTSTTTTSTTTYAISGYGYTHLNYYSYVTQGQFPGTVWLSSPDHGLVAGRRNVGSGSVLFVNLPLGYFKAIGSDSAPIQGFLEAFAKEVVGMPRMSLQPRGVGSLVFNWHVDDGGDLRSDMKYLMDNTNVLGNGPFSIHFTAGPDTAALGDGYGMSLETNTASQLQFRRVMNLPANHQLASHGGWNHDLYGYGANESNEATYLPWLVRNMTTVDGLKGRPSTEYSAPQGNNPAWAVRWLEQQGIQAMYYVGDVGAPAVRSWRDGQRLTNRLWSLPIVPQGVSATFEEFEDNNVPDSTTAQWLLDLQSYVVNNRTNRLFYAHPPGVRGHLPALRPLLSRARTLAGNGRFQWQTMTDVANFANRRVAVTWNVASTLRMSTFTASHPSSLKNMTWLLPRSRYGMPMVQSGAGSVGGDTQNWIVIANSGTQLVFRAAER